jgi:pectate lyase
MLAKRIKFMAIWIFLIPFVMIGFAGCGGGGGSSSDVTSSAVGGIAVDPYIAGAVFEEIPAEGGSPLQVSTSSDKNGYFTFPNPLTPGSTIQMKLGAQGKHNNVPYAGILKRLVDEEGTLVISPLTTLAANGLFTEEVVALLNEAGLTGLTEEDVTADPMAGLNDLTEVSAEDLIPLQASLAVNAFFSIMNNYEMDCDEAFADSDRLAEMVAMVKETINENVINSILTDPQTRMSSVSSVGVQMTLGPAINASVNITDTVVSKVKKDSTINPVSEAGFLMAYHSDLAMRYYVQQNRGQQDVEEAIAIGDLPDIQEDEIPVISENGDIVEIATSVADMNADQGIYDDIETSNVISPSAPAPRPDGSLAVFPGAEGFGTETPAGRGGKIVKVTNLNDSGQGSLREALQASGPRIVVFEVSGYIDLESQLKIGDPYITVAGQTAPSPGICLRNWGITIKTHDVLIQHLAVRPGNSAIATDGIELLGPSSNIVIDHCSVTWSTDENASTWYDDVTNFTFSNNLIAEGLLSHSMGLLLGAGFDNATLLRNVFAHNNGRNPRVQTGRTHDAHLVMINNLTYNHYWDCASISDAYEDNDPVHVNSINNIVYDGPQTKLDEAIYGFDATPGYTLYNSGDEHYPYQNLYPTGLLYTGSVSIKSSPDFDFSGYAILKTSNVENALLSSTGARPADRDRQDQRILDSINNMNGSWISSPSDVGGYTALAENYLTFDIPPDPNGDDDGDGYTNIEELLHQMATEVEGR